MSIFRSGKPSLSSFVKGIPKDLLDVLEDNEQQAGQFVCAVLDGDVPGAFSNLATEIGSDVWDDIQTGFEDVTSFIESLPSLAPQLLDGIISDGEDVGSVIVELFTNPGGALTVIEGDIMTIITDVESIATGVWHGFTCFICGCCTSSATTTLDPHALLSSSCNNIMAAATTTYSPTQHAAASSTAYPSAQPTYVASPTWAAQTSTTVQAAWTPSSASEELPAQSTAYVVATPLVTPLESTPSKVVTLTFSQTTKGSGSGGTAVPSDGALGFVLQAWVGLLACFIVVVVVL